MRSHRKGKDGVMDGWTEGREEGRKTERQELLAARSLTKIKSYYFFGSLVPSGKSAPPRF